MGFKFDAVNVGDIIRYDVSIPKRKSVKGWVLKKIDVEEDVVISPQEIAELVKQGLIPRIRRKPKRDFRTAPIRMQGVLVLVISEGRINLTYRIVFVRMVRVRIGGRTLTPPDISTMRNNARRRKRKLDSKRDKARVLTIAEENKQAKKKDKERRDEWKDLKESADEQHAQILRDRAIDRLYDKHYDLMNERTRNE